MLSFALVLFLPCVIAGIVDVRRAYGCETLCRVEATMFIGGCCCRLFLYQVRTPGHSHGERNIHGGRTLFSASVLIFLTHMLERYQLLVFFLKHPAIFSYSDWYKSLVRTEKIDDSMYDMYDLFEL